MSVLSATHLAICSAEKPTLFEMTKNKVLYIIKYPKSLNLYEKIIYKS